MKPQNEMEVALATKHNPKNDQQADATTSGTQQLNNTRLQDRRLWERILLGSVSGERLSLLDFIHFAKVSPFFNGLIQRSVAIQNQMRALASAFDRLVPIQQKYLLSQRVINLIADRQLTLNKAVAGIRQDLLPSGYYLQDLAAIEFGVSPAEMRFNWWSETHVEALKANIPFEEIESLNACQVQAILATKDTANIKALTKNDVVGVVLGAIHIEALKKGMSLAEVKTLSELQLKARFVGFSADDVRRPWLSDAHISAVKKCFPIEDVRGLSSYQLEALQLGVLRSELENVVVTYHYIAALKRGLCFKDIKGLSSQHHEVLSDGHTLEKIAHLNVAQLNYILGGWSVEEVTDSIFFKLLEENKNNYDFKSTVRSLLYKGYSLEKIKILTAAQMRYIKDYQYTLEQVTDPIFLKLLEENKNHYDFEPTIRSLLHKGYTLEEMKDLTAIQISCISNCQCTLEQVKDLVFLKFLEENKNTRNFESTITWLLQKGYPLEKVKVLTVAQLKYIISNYQYHCTLEQVTDPILLRLLEENKNTNNFEDTIRTLLQQGHSLEKMKDLTPVQISYINKYQYTLEQATNPILSKLLEENKNNYTFGFTIKFFLQQGHSLEKLKNLTAVQINYISNHKYTLEQVTDPAFVESSGESENDDSECEGGLARAKGGSEEVTEPAFLKSSGEIKNDDFECERGLAMVKGDLEEVTAPVFLKSHEETKNDNDQDAIKSVMAKGYSLEQVLELTEAQLNCIQNYNCTLAAVIQPGFLQLYAKLKDKSGYVITKLIDKDYKLEQLLDMTSEQLRILAHDELTLEQVTHPKFSRALVNAIDEGYDFETLVELEPWQHTLIGEGVPFKEVCEPNPGMTPLHNIAVLLGFKYSTIKSLDGDALSRFLATPYKNLPKTRPAPYTSTSVNDAFLTESAQQQSASTIATFADNREHPLVLHACPMGLSVASSSNSSSGAPVLFLRDSQSQQAVATLASSIISSTTTVTTTTLTNDSNNLQQIRPRRNSDSGL